MAPYRGLDADQDVTPYLADIANSGMSFFMGYLKVLTPAMIVAAHALDFAVGLIFEAGAGNALKGSDQGADDGFRAMAQAVKLGAPTDCTVAIYAAVDTSVGDLEPAQRDAVIDYFSAFNTTICPKFDIGAYADGSMLDALRPHGLKLEWLPGAMGWEGSRSYLENRRPTLIQGPTLTSGGSWPTGATLASLQMSALEWPDLDIPGGYDPDLCLVEPKEAGLWMPTGTLA